MAFVPMEINGQTHLMLHGKILGIFAGIAIPIWGFWLTRCARIFTPLLMLLLLFSIQRSSRLFTNLVLPHNSEINIWLIPQLPHRLFPEILYLAEMSHLSILFRGNLSYGDFSLSHWRFSSFYFFIIL